MFRLEALFERHYGARQLRPQNSSALKSRMDEQLKRLKTDSFRVRVPNTPTEQPGTERNVSKQSWALR